MMLKMPSLPTRLMLCCALLASAAGHAATVQIDVADGAGKPLADAVVFLESKEARAAAKPVRDVAIAQVDKQFSPRVVVVPVGSLISFPNRDKVRHHVYSFSPTKTFELKLYTGMPDNPVEFDKAGIAVLGCNIHDNMSAWVVVVETPYYARTAADGKVSLANVPPGSYRLRAWHPELPVGTPASDQPISVVAAGNAASVRLSGSAR